MPKNHQTHFRIYYEDTDAGGVVYHANYFRFAERARTDLLREARIVQSELRAKEGVIFVVRHAEISYHRAARLDDLVSVVTALQKMGGASMTLKQDILRGDELLAEITIVIVCVAASSSGDMKPTRVPESVRALF